MLIVFLELRDVKHRAVYKDWERWSGCPAIRDGNTTKGMARCPSGVGGKAPLCLMKPHGNPLITVKGGIFTRKKLFMPFLEPLRAWFIVK